MRKFIKSQQAVILAKVLANGTAFAVLAAVVAAPAKWS